MTLAMNALFGATFFLTLAALVLALAGMVRPSVLRFGQWTTTAAAVVSLLGIGVRWSVAGHPAMFGTFENMYALASILLVCAAIAGVIAPRWAGVWRWAVPWALAALLYGTRFRSDAVPLTISERSLWVDVHVVFAWIGFVAILAASTASMIRSVGRRSPLGMDDAACDRFITECLMCGFCGLNGMLATGAWYSFILFGVFWQWSVVETLCLSAWLGYAVVVHGRLFYGWAGRRLDLAVLLVLPVLLAGYLIWSVFPGTWHYFDVPLVKPY